MKWNDQFLEQLWETAIENIRLTHDEAMVIIASTGTTAYDHWTIALFHESIRDALHFDIPRGIQEFAAHRNVDTDTLCAKVQRLSDVQKLALWFAVLKFNELTDGFIRAGRSIYL